MAETSKEEFLAAVSQALGHDAVPQMILDGYDYNSGRQYSYLRGLNDEELRRVFEREAPVRDFTYLECTAAELGGQLAQLVAKEAPKRVTCPKETPFEGLDLYGLLQEAAKDTEVYAYDPQAEPVAQRAMLEASDMSVTLPFRAIADTGTYVEISDKTASKGLSLLAPAHVAVIPQSRLRATLTDVAQEFEALRAQEGPDGYPSYISMVSGPSSTGDIANVLVTGVHGPTREYYLVVKDL